MTTTAETGMAKIIPSGQALPHDARCEMCRAQAWVEVELMIPNEKGVRVKDCLFFCAHHYRERSPDLERAATRIIDHRGVLNRMEGHS